MGALSRCMWKQEKKSLKTWERVWIWGKFISRSQPRCIHFDSQNRERKGWNIYSTWCGVWGAKAHNALTSGWWLKCLSGFIYFFRSVSTLGFSILSWRGVADTLQEQHLVVKHAGAAPGGECISITEYIENIYNPWLFSIDELHCICSKLGNV